MMASVTPAVCSNSVMNSTIHNTSIAIMAISFAVHSSKLLYGRCKLRVGLSCLAASVIGLTVSCCGGTFYMLLDVIVKLVVL